jgi:hypothetical protein
MSTASGTLYAERVGRQTPREAIDSALVELQTGKTSFARTSLAERIALAEACLEGTARVAEAWVAAACQAKGVAETGAAAGEEWTAGPVATVRYLRLLVQTLTDVNTRGALRLPGRIIERADGRIELPVFPCRGLFDSLLFRGFRIRAPMLPEVSRQNLSAYLPSREKLTSQPPGVALVLGAGNVASIPAVDTFGKLFQSGKVVLLKMNPVNEYLGPIFEQAFEPLVRAGCLRIIYGGAEVGSYAAGHASVDEIHITGSALTHEMLVWGPPGAERERRKREHDPLLAKPITSELGNVTPWIIVPGEYSGRELRFQAENVAAMIVNNASFNCIALKMIVTWQGWPDRERFLDMVDAILARVPRRRAYYPGAAGRFERFAGHASDELDAFPWTLIRGERIEERPELFREESFVCVTAETALAAASPSDFLSRATEFVNDSLWGTLGIGLMVPRRFRREHQQHFDRCIDSLKYGTVAINQWCALSYALMTPPWGGYPGASLADSQSGLGWVHNAYLLEGVEKTVLDGPLTVWPRPTWFPSHRHADVVARRLLEMYRRPAVWKLPGIVLPAALG